MHEVVVWSATRLRDIILAGGLSSRMGRDKSRLRLGRQTLLQHVRASAGQLNLPVRVVRRDAVARCGPLGGIYTGLKRSRARLVLFMACDMPFVPPRFLRQMIQAASPERAVFAWESNRAGFPCLLPRQTSLPQVLKQIKAAEFSLQTLAKILGAKKLRPKRQLQSLNINTPADFKKPRVAARRNLACEAS